MVGRGIAVLDGGQRSPTARGGFGFFLHFRNGKCHYVADGEFLKPKRHLNLPMLTISSAKWQRESR